MIIMHGASSAAGEGLPERKEDKPALPWEEERKQMAEVIKRQMEYIFKLRQHSAALQQVVEQQQKKLEEYARPVENLEKEFIESREDIRFTDIGGLDHVVDKIRLFEYGMMYPKMYEAYAIRPPRGLLLHGPPGCGKTMIGKAISKEIGAYFLEIPVTRFISKYVGEAENTLEAILKRCNDIHKESGVKVVVFMDEAEQVFGRRGMQHDGVMDRCKQVWLRYMDGLVDNDGLIYVAATNRIDIIDEAIKRAGRFDHVIEIPKPDRKGVEDILRKQVAYKERMAKRQIYLIDDYGRLADMLYKLDVNGADIAEVLRITSERQIRQFIEMPEEQMIDPAETLILQRRIEETITEYNPAGRKAEPKRIGFGV
ncbi:ATP-binding protein [Candidatus Woesearchaeota archaeon]|nr:ATP-binding protein [Candidatus Woesearchaeota archaeon]